MPDDEEVEELLAVELVEGVPDPDGDEDLEAVPL